MTRVVAWMVGLAALVGSGAYVFVYIYRWEWNRALIMLGFFVATEVALSTALAELKLAGALPDLVVSLGSAGSRKLVRTEVYQVSSVIYRDMDATAFGFEKGTTPYLDLPATLPLPLRIPGVKKASISTGGTIIAGETQCPSAYLSQTSQYTS